MIGFDTLGGRPHYNEIDKMIGYIHKCVPKKSYYHCNTPITNTAL